MSSVEKKAFYLDCMVNPKNLFNFYAESKVKTLPHPHQKKKRGHTGCAALVYSTAFLCSPQYFFGEPTFLLSYFRS